MNLSDSLCQQVLGGSERSHNVFNLLNPSNTQKCKNLMLYLKIIYYSFDTVTLNSNMLCKTT